MVTLLIPCFQKSDLAALTIASNFPDCFSIYITNLKKVYKYNINIQTTYITYKLVSYILFNMLTGEVQFIFYLCGFE
jgi:hypothetical protein